MLRWILFLAIVLGLAWVSWVLLSRLKGRTIFADTPGKIIVALILAGLAFWLFGGGALMDPAVHGMGQ